MEILMTLNTAFDSPVHDAQQCFRRLLKAMSEPGVIVSLQLLRHGWQPLGVATTSVLLTLVDSDTPVWLSPSLANDIVRSNLRFHTGTRIADTPDEAVFAIADENLNPLLPDRLAHGSVIAGTQRHAGVAGKQPERRTYAAPDRRRYRGRAHDRAAVAGVPD